MTKDTEFTEDEIAMFELMDQSMRSLSKGKKKKERMPISIRIILSTMLAKNVANAIKRFTSE